MSKTLALRYFASVREALGSAGETWQTDALDVAELRRELASHSARYAVVFGAPALRCAVAQQMASDSSPLSDGVEVAFFPPVTGG